MADKKTEDKRKAQLVEIERIMAANKIEVIKNIATPEVKNRIKSAPEYIRENGDMLSAIGLFLKDSEKVNAVGLAANQISCNGKRIEDNWFIIKQNMGLRDSGFDIIFNPKIMEKRGTVVTKYEECLTWDDSCVVVDRQPFIIVSFQDMKGVKHEGIAITGFEAQVWQHEIDHLEGVKENLILKSEKPKERTVSKVGRNDICKCGSGKKYKKCCQLYDNNW